MQAKNSNSQAKDGGYEEAGISNKNNGEGQMAQVVLQGLKKTEHNEDDAKISNLAAKKPGLLTSISSNIKKISVPNVFSFNKNNISKVKMDNNHIEMGGHLNSENQ